MKVQTWPSVGVAPCREQSGRAVLDAQLDVSYFGAHSRPEKPPHRFPAMHAALHRVPRYFTDCSAVPRAPPYSAGVSVESAPRVYEHLQSAVVLQCTRFTMRPSRACQGLSSVRSGGDPVFAWRAAPAERPERSSFVASLDVDLLIHRAFLRTMPHAIQRPRIAVRARHSVVGRVVGRVLVAGGKADRRGLYRPTDAGKLPHTSALCRPIESSGNA